jgi:mRNA-degrading endonuclease toxin of MazEF toxin-antitoxin module
MPEYRRGDVWIVDLKPGTHPEEPAKERPCLIIQDSKICAVAQHGTIIVIPVSSSSEDPEIEEDEIRVPLGSFEKDPSGKQEIGYALVDCIRSVSKKRFKRGPVHTCPVTAMRKIEKALRFFLALH